ncbi:MAG: LysR family transcriptional regulator [Burkholderia ambifaria]
MNTRFVETFVLLARIGSVRRVAERLHATPGAISMRVRALETELGVTLFDWDRKTLQLTADGQRLLRHAENLVDATRAIERIAKSPGEAGGRVKVGVNETVVHTFLPEMMKALAASLPGVEIDLTVDLTVNLADHLLRGDLDFVIRVAGDNDNPFVVTQNLLELPVHWIARKGSVPARDTLRKVLDKQLLTQMRGSAPYTAAVNLARELAAQHGLSPNDLRISGSPSLAALVSLVREGVGVAIMPGLLVKEHLERGELVDLALPAPPPFRIASWYQKTAPPAVPHVAEIVRRVCKTYCRRVNERWVHHIG